MQVRNLAILACVGLAAAQPRLSRRDGPHLLISSISTGDAVPQAPSVVAPSPASPSGDPQSPTLLSSSEQVPSLAPVAAPSPSVPSSAAGESTILAPQPAPYSASKPISNLIGTGGANAGTSSSASNSASSAASSSLAAALISIAPWTSSCSTSQGNAAQQCATASSAAPAILNSFSTYGLTSTNEKAAMISLMLYESVQFKYNRPINAEAGKGTRAMLSGMYTQEYAASVPALQSKLGSGASGPDVAVDALTADLNLDFGAAAWFLTSQCGPDVVAALKTGRQAEWEAYLQGCVRVSPQEGNRTAWYTATVKALGGY